MAAVSRKRAYVAPTTKFSDDYAQQETSTITALMPERLRGACSPNDYAGAYQIDQSNVITVTPDCKDLLDVCTRAVKLELLLKHDANSLHAFDGKQRKLKAQHFFLSRPVQRLAFVSHVWTNDRHETAHAMKTWAHVNILVSMIWAWAAFMVFGPLVYPPLPLVCMPLYFWALWFYQSELWVKCMYDKPYFWFDKATIHQTEPALCALGLFMFSYFLAKGDELIVLYNDKYFSRIWCCYEISQWVATKGTKGLVLIPLRAYHKITVKCLQWWTPTIMFCEFCMTVCWVIGFTMARAAASDVTKMIVIVAFMLVIALPTACCVGLWFHEMIFGEYMSAEIGTVVQQVKSFDVRECVATQASDIPKVCGMIHDSWNQREGKPQESHMNDDN